MSSHFAPLRVMSPSPSCICIVVKCLDISKIYPCCLGLFMIFCSICLTFHIYSAIRLRTHQWSPPTSFSHGSVLSLFLFPTNHWDREMGLLLFSSCSHKSVTWVEGGHRSTYLLSVRTANTISSPKFQLSVSFVSRYMSVCPYNFAPTSCLSVGSVS